MNNPQGWRYMLLGNISFLAHFKNQIVYFNAHFWYFLVHCFVNVFSVLERETPEFIHVFNAYHKVLYTLYVRGIFPALRR